MVPYKCGQRKKLRLVRCFFYKPVWVFLISDYSLLIKFALLKTNFMNPDLNNFLLHLHSILRWVLLLLLLVAIFNSLVAGNRPFIRSDARTGSILVIFADVQLLLGLALWFMGSKGYKVIEQQGWSAAMKGADRFFVIEHFAGMFIAIILLHIGKAQGRKAISDAAKHRRTLVFYLLALLIILVSIPWPFRQAGANSHWY